MYLGIHLSRDKAYVFILLYFSKERNGLTVKMEFIGINRRTKEEIEIHEEFKCLSTLEMQGDKNFNFITFD